MPCTASPSSTTLHASCPLPSNLRDVTPNHSGTLTGRALLLHAPATASSPADLGNGMLEMALLLFPGPVHLITLVILPWSDLILHKSTGSPPFLLQSQIPGMKITVTDPWPGWGCFSDRHQRPWPPNTGHCQWTLHGSYRSRGIDDLRVCQATRVSASAWNHRLFSNPSSS